MSNFNHGVKSFGVPILPGIGGNVYTGNVYFVNSTSTTRSNNPSSGTKSSPFSTIDYAIGRCTANNGDVIIAMPGHTETVSADNGLAIDVAGITFIGVGNGSLRPTINVTATTGDVEISAANTTMCNFLITGGIDVITGVVNISAADCTLLNIETRDVTGQATDFIVTTAAADRLKISGWVHNGATAAGADTALSIVGGDGIIVEDFNIFGNFAVAAIENVTTAMTNATIGGGIKQNYIQNGLDSTTPVAITLVSTSTGHVGPNINIRIGLDSTSNTTNITEAVVGAAMQMFLPINIANLGGEVAMATNITAATDA